MARRTNHPLKTLFLLAVLGGVAWGAYEFIYRRGILRHEATHLDVEETRESVRTAIFAEFESDPCLVTLDEISYRANEDHFRVRVTVSHDCYDQAREICERIAAIGSSVTDQSFGVFAYDRGGNLLVKFIQ